MSTLTNKSRRKGEHAPVGRQEAKATPKTAGAPGGEHLPPKPAFGGKADNGNTAKQGRYSDQESHITPKQGSGANAHKATIAVKNNKGDGTKGEQREGEGKGMAGRERGR